MLDPSVVFEAVDEFPDWTVKQGRGACPGKSGRFADTAAADMVFAAFRLEGDTANLAQRGVDQAAPFQARRAEVQLSGIRDKGFAEMASGRKDYVEQRTQHRNYISCIPNHKVKIKGNGTRMMRLRAETLQRAGTKIMKGKKTSSMIHMKTVLVNGFISSIDRFLCGLCAWFARVN